MWKENWQVLHDPLSQSSFVSEQCHLLSAISTNFNLLLQRTNHSKPQFFQYRTTSSLSEKVTAGSVNMHLSSIIVLGLATAATALPYVDSNPDDTNQTLEKRAF